MFFARISRKWYIRTGHVCLLALAMVLAACSSPLMYSGQMDTSAGLARMPMAADAPVVGESSPDVKHNTEAYDRIVDNPFLAVAGNPLSTFSIDVDTASYSNMRRFIAQMNQLPPKDAVRIEEFINYFTYEYATPTDGRPFAVHLDLADCPWQSGHRLARIAIKGMEITPDKRPTSNLVFLIDTSGSMGSENKLPLLKEAMKLLVEQLAPNDRVAIVTYAGSAGLVLSSTPAENRGKILKALDRLKSGGSTNGGAGIQLAYNVAAKNMIEGGVNRVILCTDGDFNVGVTNQGDLTRLIEDSAKTGVFLSVLGFGMGNYKDSTMEKLADMGNGNYAYIDTINEAKKVLVEQMSGTLITIAKDVKIQVEFNPAHVAAYRLIGYENRMLRKEDFNDDQKDAGDIGAGHTVTAIYQLVPPGQEKNLAIPTVDALKYSTPTPAADGRHTGELLTVKLRYKEPEGQVSKLIEMPLPAPAGPLAPLAGDFRFAASVASFGMNLRESPHRGTWGLDHLLASARESVGADRSGYRREFLDLVQKASTLRQAHPLAAAPADAPR